jgi:hypothetical protein
VRFFGDLRMFLRAKDHLGEALAIAEIDKDYAAVVAPGVDPSAKGNRLVDVGFARVVAGMSAIHE